jgi:hypothetical protein
VLIPHDDFPIHQTPLPLAHVMDGHPNAYDRFWFNGYSEDYFFAVAMGLYPNRGVIDAAFSWSSGGVQQSVFSSDALVGRPTAVGAVTIDIIEPLRINRIRVNAPEQGLFADLTYTQRTVTVEEPRQTMWDGTRIFMDVTRATQLGTWTGWVQTPEGRVEIDDARGTKDRSWGIRPVGEPIPGAPSSRAAQLCFLWSPLHFSDGGVHFMTFDGPDGSPVSRSAAVLPLVGVGAPRTTSGTLSLHLEPGTRRSQSASLWLEGDEIKMTPLQIFHMRGAGYGHPEYAHGRWHGGPVTAGEVLRLDQISPLDYHGLHVQQVVRAQRQGEVGIGVLEQLIIGPYSPGGLSGLIDGA